MYNGNGSRKSDKADEKRWALVGEMICAAGQAGGEEDDRSVTWW